MELLDKLCTKRPRRAGEVSKRFQNHAITGHHRMSIRNLLSSCKGGLAPIIGR